jgi:aminoglycoside 6'-N-acetyltransferase
MRLKGKLTELVLRSLTPSDETELLRICHEPEVARWWGAPKPDLLNTEKPDRTLLVIEFDGAVAGLIQFYEESEPRYRHASIDLFLDPQLHGRGIGTSSIRLLADYLVSERGHHRITIDPAAGNNAAIRVYEKVGFRRVGVMHYYERDSSGEGWHDGVLMELLADKLPPVSS